MYYFGVLVKIHFVRMYVLFVTCKSTYSNLWLDHELKQVWQVMQIDTRQHIYTLYALRMEWNRSWSWCWWIFIMLTLYMFPLMVHRANCSKEQSRVDYLGLQRSVPGCHQPQVFRGKAWFMIPHVLVETLQRNIRENIISVTYQLKTTVCSAKCGRVGDQWDSSTTFLWSQ
jgi:hypothetical protein